MGEAWVTQESKLRPKINKQLPLNIQDATIVGICAEKKVKCNVKWYWLHYVYSVGGGGHLIIELLNIKQRRVKVKSLGKYISTYLYSVVLPMYYGTFQCLHLAKMVSYNN